MTETDMAYERLLKIDPEQRSPLTGEPVCVIQFIGHDQDGDHVMVALRGEDARLFLRLARAIARRRSISLVTLIHGIDPAYPGAEIEVQGNDH